MQIVILGGDENVEVVTIPLIPGATGPAGQSVEVIEFATDAAAQTYSAANPTAIVISTEGA